MAGIPGQPTPNPTDLSSPVPNPGTGLTPQESSYMEQFSADETAYLDKNFGESGPGNSIITADAGGGSKGLANPNGPSAPMMFLDGMARAADLPGGIVRTAGAGVLAAATGQPEAVTMEDAKNAFKGKAPNSAEYLRRLGVSEGASIKMPILGKVTLRGAEGLALDIISDPLTLISKAIKSAPYIQKMLEAPGRATQAFGEAVYKSAIRSRAAGAGAEAADTAAKVLVEQGAPIGGTAALAEKVNEAATTMGNIRQGLFDKFNELSGGKASFDPNKFTRARAMVDNLKKNPTTREYAEQLENTIAQYTAEGFIPIEDMTLMMNQLFDSLPKSVTKGANRKNIGNMFKAALAEDMRTQIKQFGNVADPGLGDALLDVNSKWGALLDVGPKMSDASSNLGKKIDALTLALGGPKAYAVKKAYDVATGPYAKTVAGKALMEAGKTDVVNRLSRQVLADVMGRGSQE